MNIKSVTWLAIRIAGMIIIIQAIALVPQSLLLGLQRTTLDVPIWIPLVQALSMVLTPLALGLAMFRLAGFFTNLVVRDAPEGAASGEPGKIVQQIESAALTVLGVYLLFKAISDAVYTFAKAEIVYVWYGSQYPELKITASDFGRIFVIVTEVILSLILIFGSTGLVRIRDWARRGSVT